MECICDLVHRILEIITDTMEICGLEELDLTKVQNLSVIVEKIQKKARLKGRRVAALFETAQQWIMIPKGYDFEGEILHYSKKSNK
jgi:hypothetical protein